METLLFVALLYIVLGVLVKYGKFYNLIAGYNTMPETQKKRYDIDGIASVFRNAMFGMALIIVLGYLLGLWLDNSQMTLYALFIASAIGIPYLLVRSNAARYRKTEDDN
ncbi:DUF3784 domain-containing protein [Robertkochia sediminum]|uniref:DUF3784 domain-containing protein n=1 Tax=Robertkochia sediminum TaxID=2785326 RepID=UPI0019314914|nr:DUF3784 domain-containing protein [Robertkochia sediminum]MBL7472242.1 DUF3784 domain-containing protein [Robertkochia sediminum]